MNVPPFGFDPSKMDPKVLMQLSQMIQQLPPQQLSRMQTLMHNMMAGHDVKKDMEEFERNLPPGFREKMMAVMGGQFGTSSPQNEEIIEVQPVRDEKREDANMDVHQARLTILHAVAEGNMSPEDAEKLLFA